MPSHSHDGHSSHDAAATSEHVANDHAAGEYVVVARRYRPKTFGELVGQQQVAQALGNAISTNRVGHAYLFTGARGVGKTSTARTGEMRICSLTLFWIRSIAAALSC